MHTAALPRMRGFEIAFLRLVRCNCPIIEILRLGDIFVFYAGNLLRGLGLNAGIFCPRLTFDLTYLPSV